MPLGRYTSSFIAPGSGSAPPSASLASAFARLHPHTLIVIACCRSLIVTPYIYLYLTYHLPSYNTPRAHSLTHSLLSLFAPSHKGPVPNQQDQLLALIFLALNKYPSPGPHPRTPRIQRTHGSPHCSPKSLPQLDAFIFSIIVSCFLLPQPRNIPRPANPAEQDQNRRVPFTHSACWLSRKLFPHPSWPLRP